MKINAIGRQVTVTEDLKKLFDKKLAKFDKFFRDDAEATLKLRERKNGRKILELTKISGGTIYRAETEDETYQNALDRDIYAIERQIRKNKTRLEKRLRDGAFERSISPEQEVIIPDEEEEGEFDIRTKKFSFKPMSPEEAIQQMNLIGHEFFIFENDETHLINVVYKRHGNKYGLIIPD